MMDKGDETMIVKYTMDGNYIHIEWEGIGYNYPYRHLQSFAAMTLADDTTGIDYFYWNKEEGEWRTDSTCHSRWTNVYYWSKDDPEDWVNSDPPVRKRTKLKDNPALDIAWQNVERAVAQYELIRSLVTHDNRYPE
jgi:hypothetical protein